MVFFHGIKCFLNIPKDERQSKNNGFCSEYLARFRF